MDPIQGTEEDSQRHNDDADGDCDYKFEEDSVSRADVALPIASEGDDQLYAREDEFDSEEHEELILGEVLPAFEVEDGDETDADLNETYDGHQLVEGSVAAL